MVSTKSRVILITDENEANVAGFNDALKSIGGGEVMFDLGPVIAQATGAVIDRQVYFGEISNLDVTALEHLFASTPWKYVDSTLMLHQPPGGSGFHFSTAVSD